MTEPDFQAEVMTTLARIEVKLDAACGDIIQREREHDELRDRVDAQGLELAGMKVKVGFWGVVAGLIAGTLAALGIRQ